MKFLVDAHLPQRLSRWLISKGYDSIHTLDLPAQNSTDELRSIYSNKLFVLLSKGK